MPSPEVVLPVLEWLAFTSVGSAVVLGILDGVRGY